MFTKEFVIEAARIKRLEEDANTLLYKMKNLNILNKDVENQCNKIINDAKDFNKSALDYMYSFVPEELKQQLNIVEITGAYATNITGKSAFNAELSLRLEPYEIIHLKFDNDKKCLYHQSGKYSGLLDKYFKNNSSFYAWIRY